MISQKMINLRVPVLVFSIFFFVFLSFTFMFATPSFAARVGHSLVQEEVTKISEYKRLQEPEMLEEAELPLPEEPEVPDEPEDPEEPQVPEEPEEPPKEPEEPKYEFPSWIPSFPFPGVNGGSLKTEKKKPTAEEVAVKSSSVSKEPLNASVLNKKP